MTTLLHTSDWHLGSKLYGQVRYEEYTAFLEWLIRFIIEQTVDILVISGDVFDTTTPTNFAQQQYYRFLSRLTKTCCRHVVVVGGNHDSGSFLDAPKQLLKAMNVYVLGSVSSDIEDEILVISDAAGSPEMLICAVPYLRDRDIRTAAAGESIEDKGQRLVKGIKDHYAGVWEKAKSTVPQWQEIPVVATGHLFAAGGKTVTGDGVRQLYVGTIAQVGHEVFPNAFDYVALGHLHSAQTVGKQEWIRYCGSPLPMGFGEAKQEKKVVLVRFEGKKPEISEHPVPVFQQLKLISGSMEDILDNIAGLAEQDSRAWLEIEYTGEQMAADLRNTLAEAVENTAMQILRIRNSRIREQVMKAGHPEQMLDDLTPREVFRHLLDAHKIGSEEQKILTAAYNEVLTAVLEKDSLAE